MSQDIGDSRTHDRGSGSVKAAGSAGPPATVPVSLTVNGGGTQLVTNGGFEKSASPWLGTGHSHWAADPVVPYQLPPQTGFHSGRGYAYLGGANTAGGALYESLTIPATATRANLSFFLRTATAEATTSVQYDKLFVEITDTSARVLARVATFSNVDSSGYRLKGGYNLLAYKGQTILLQFRVLTDETRPTTFYIDDVSIN